MKTFVLMCLALTSIALNACVEVRDAEKKEEVPAEETRPVIEAQAPEKKPNLFVDREMFVYQGEILTIDQIEARNPDLVRNQFGFGRYFMKESIRWSPTNLILSFGKIEITSQGKLYTMGNDVKLIADEFISNRGSIETIPQGTKAQINQAGMNGGYLTLQVGRAEGELFVTLRGQEGGNGSNGSDGKTFMGTARLGQCLTSEAATLNAGPGAPGRQGGDTGSIKVKGEISNLDIRIRREQGKGGAGGNPGTPSRCTDGGDYTEAGGHWLQGQAAAAGAPGADGKVLE